jgi:hypothetical protein
VALSSNPSNEKKNVASFHLHRVPSEVLGRKDLSSVFIWFGTGCKNKILNSGGSGLLPLSTLTYPLPSVIVSLPLGSVGVAKGKLS